MKNLFKVTFVALLAAVMVSCGSASKEDADAAEAAKTEFEQLIADGDGKLGSEDFDAAIAAYTEALNTGFDNATANAKIKEAEDAKQAKEDFVGQWTPDLSTIDIHLSEDIPSELSENVDIDELKSEAKKGQSEADKMIIEFKEDGKLTLGPKGETKDFSWDIDGDELIITGELDEGPVKGKEFNLALEIVESGSDAFTLKLSAMSLKEQVEAQFKDEMDEAMAQFGPMMSLINDDILTDTWASISFKKKEAES